MNAAQFIRLASDITEYGKPCGYYEYVDNIINQNRNDAAKYYGVRPYEITRYAEMIAKSLENIGCVVIPECLTNPLEY